MTRTYIAAMLIIIATGLVAEGMVTAADELRPARVSASQQPQAIWHGVDPTRPKPVNVLIKRTLVAKPTMIEWPADAKDARLMVKFHDDLLVRLDASGTPYSLNQHNIDSLNTLLTDMNLSLEPVYNIDPVRMQGLINRAELYSGKAQADMAGT